MKDKILKTLFSIQKNGHRITIKILGFKIKRKLKLNYFVDRDVEINNSEIGEYTYIGPLTYVNKCSIGRYCSIGQRVLIGMNEHDMTEISMHHLLSEPNHDVEHMTRKNIEIGHDVWIGGNVVVRRGVKIGNGAVIGSSAVVTRDIPDFAIAVGNPAKIIKYRFSNDLQKEILKSKYWDFEPNKAKKIIRELEYKYGK